MKLFVAVLLAGMAVVSATEAWAHDRHRGRTRIGVFVGAPLWPWYYPSPFYYPPVITVPAPPPPVYVEQAPAPAATENYWYYCINPEGYYPYVKECPDGWQKVSPRP